MPAVEAPIKPSPTKAPPKIEEWPVKPDEPPVSDPCRDDDAHRRFLGK